MRFGVVFCTATVAGGFDAFSMRKKFSAILSKLLRDPVFPISITILSRDTYPVPDDKTCLSSTAIFTIVGNSHV
ncbi:hypothetical protein RhiirA5_434640 [Rhizophagus irregularis]|uniref:Uncharacterized protein n=1 Tax=Rhizophagus irregularis TaxID=588596 RepID=A0A2N0NPQ6_9GLOM|nr:hypothetical protein RhiirA5_434640 [Rhizophagus irregularis]GET55551.1 hypothetical protein RIR_jg16483.t1 [Rhizophagus irregularis DAOM 181602=DAOM 197198]